MSLGTITSVLEAGKSPSDPLMVINATIVGDGAYPTGGTASFSATLSAALPRTVEVVGVQGYGIAGGVTYLLQYDAANDKLVVLDGADNMDEVDDTTSLASVTFKATIWAR